MPSRRDLPRIMRIIFAEEERFRCGLVVPKTADDKEILSEQPHSLNPNYIRWIRTGFPRNLGPDHPKALLYLLLRHGALLEQARAGLRILQERGLATKAEAFDHELVNVVASARGISELLDQPVAGLTGRATLRDYLLEPVPTTAVRTPAQRIVDEYREALGELEPLSTAEMERLFTETLDTCAYRLDAWTTALATKRLEAMRKRAPAGAHVGAYGWVENLKPFPADGRGAVEIEGEPGVTAFTHSGGYVYAPSMSHGAAAGVLRNAFMTTAGNEPSPFAIDLSSARVRQALWLLDTVREGQPLGAALGYLLERGLHDAHLDRLIDLLRSVFPFLEGLAESAEPAESIAARNVADGYALVRARRQWQKDRTGKWNEVVVPDGLVAPMNVVIDEVDRALDALADLLTAESVYQLVGGSVAGAGASLDAMAKGAHPPEPEIVRWPRGGTSVTHRVALVLGQGPLPAGPWPAEPLTPRALTEPLINAWVGRLLGDPGTVRCEAVFATGGPVAITLRQLDLQPLDVLALARGDTEDEPRDSELARRIKQVARGRAAAGQSGALTVRLHVPGLDPPQRSLFEVLELARGIGVVLSGARPLGPKDLVVPEDAGAVAARGALIRDAELLGRVDAAQALLAAAIVGLDAALAAPGAAPDLPALRAALARAALFGAASAFPPESGRDLVAVGQSVLEELGKRRDRAAAERDQIKRAREIFGRDFLILPAFRPAGQAELNQAIARRAGLGADAEPTLGTWFATAARVRPPLAAWRLLSLYAGALGRPLPALRVAQLPHDDTARWVGLDFRAADLRRPRAGQVSVALAPEVVPAGDADWAGVLIDEWVELIPNARADAGVVFHYDRPGAEAPHAVLLTVPPLETTPWSLDLVHRTVLHTLAAARLRGFDGEWKHSTGELGHAFYGNPWLPLILVAQNSEDVTISTSFDACVGREPTG